MVVEYWSIELILSISQNKAIDSQLFSQYEGARSNKPTDILIRRLLDDVWSAAEYNESGIKIVFTDLDLFRDFVKVINDKVIVRLKKLLSKNPSDIELKSWDNGIDVLEKKLIEMVKSVEV